mgnify:CR=1 FL=1
MADLKETVSDPATWQRLLYMLLFCVAFNIAGAVIAVLVIVQFLLKLCTGEVNQRLQQTGGEAGLYLQQVVGYLTYRTEVMPYPFAPWPEEGKAAVAPASRPKPRRSRVPKPPKANDDEAGV